VQSKERSKLASYRSKRSSHGAAGMLCPKLWRCVYNGDKQKNAKNPGLKEEDAYPRIGGGWVRLGEAFQRENVPPFPRGFGLATRIARFHNVYGPLGTWDGGREKAPAAICRKVVEAKISGRHEISIWGSGNQTQSFMYIDDCLKGIHLIMNSTILEPINLGSSEMVTINQLVDITEQIAGIKLKRSYDLSAPKGVNGRNSEIRSLRNIWAGSQARR
jgi:nucleoside-diphosphate-sugar epimerase